MPIVTPDEIKGARLQIFSPDGQANETLLNKFNAFFKATIARTEGEIEESQRVRYQVYCVENPFEDAATHPDGIERDEFDAHSAHSLLMHRATEQYMGTARLILPVAGSLERSFPIQLVCQDPMLRRLPLHRTGEVSRFSISKAFRRRKSDTLYEGSDPLRGQEGMVPLMTLGLLQSIVRMSFENEITHLFATMEPPLLRLLAAVSIRFKLLGPLVQYHGMRQPCYCELAPLLQCVKKEQRQVWEVLTDGGSLKDRPRLAA